MKIGLIEDKCLVWRKTGRLLISKRRSKAEWKKEVRVRLGIFYRTKFNRVPDLAQSKRKGKLFFSERKIL